MNFALRCVHISPGVNSRAELVTLAPRLRPEQRFTQLAQGQGWQVCDRIQTLNHEKIQQIFKKNNRFLKLKSSVIGWENFKILVSQSQS